MRLNEATGTHTLNGTGSMVLGRAEPTVYVLVHRQELQQACKSFNRPSQLLQQRGRMAAPPQVACTGTADLRAHLSTAPTAPAGPPAAAASMHIAPAALLQPALPGALQLPWPEPWQWLMPSCRQPPLMLPSGLPHALRLHGQIVAKQSAAVWRMKEGTGEV